MTAAQTRSRAADMIERNGQTVTLTRRASGTYNPATGTAAITTTTQAVKAVVLPLSAFRKGQGNIVEGDRQMLLSALKTDGTALTAPVVDDSVTLADTTVATITAVDPLAPAGTALFYDCIVRRAA